MRNLPTCVLQMNRLRNWLFCFWPLGLGPFVVSLWRTDAPVQEIFSWSRENHTHGARVFPWPINGHLTTWYSIYNITILFVAAFDVALALLEAHREPNASDMQDFPLLVQVFIWRFRFEDYLDSFRPFNLRDLSRYLRGGPKPSKPVNGMPKRFDRANRKPATPSRQ